MYDDDIEYSTTSKEVTIYRNGNIELQTKIRITKATKLLKIFQLIEEKLKLKGAKTLRLFDEQGVEIFEDDLEFIKNGKVLYASIGEDFDRKSSLLEFEILEKLGEGGFGKVMLGKHKTTGEKVAIKYVNLSQIKNPQDIDMVFREAEMLKSLYHKNIVKLINCFAMKNKEMVFIMEYLEGGELLKYVSDREKLKEEEAKIFFIQLAEAMNYCHKERLIHRDLKLENLLLANKKDKLLKVMLQHFNHDQQRLLILELLVLVKILLPRMLKQDHSLISRRKFFQESQNLLLRQLIFERWGAFYMGIFFFLANLYDLLRMVVGKLPFSGNSNSEIIEKIVNQELKFTKNQEQELSKEIRDLLQKLLKKEFKERISMIDILDHHWIVGTKIKEEEEKLNPVLEETKTKPKKATKANLQKRNSGNQEKVTPRLKNQLQPKRSVNYSKNVQLISQKKK